MPDLPENTFPIAPPLVIPEAQLFNVLGGQELFSRRIMFLLPGQPVFKAIQFHRQPGRRTIEVKKVSAKWMLPAEFEPCKATGSQGLPELRLFPRLLASQPPGVAGRIHGAKRRHSLKKDKPWPSARAIRQQR